MKKKSMGRPRTRTDRDIRLARLWNKLDRTVFAMVQYDIILNKYKPRLKRSEIKKLKTALSQAIDDAVKSSKK